MREMKFACGACGEFSKKAFVSRHTASYVPHEACGYETFFPNFVPHRDPRGKSVFDPVGTLIRPIGENGDGMPVAEFKEIMKAGRVKVPLGCATAPSNPSGNDLDKVMEERTVVVTERLYSLGLTPDSVKQIMAHFGVMKLFETPDAAALETLLEELDHASDAPKRVEEFDQSDPNDPRRLAVEHLLSTGMSKSEAKRLVKQKGPIKVLKEAAQNGSAA